METTELTGIDAVKAKIRFAELARRMNVTRGAIAQWKRVPAERLGEVAAITGLAPHVIRPDLFPASPVNG